MDDTDIALLPDSIYSRIYSLLAERQGAPRGKKAGFSWTGSPHPVWGRACFDLDLRRDAPAILAELESTARSLGAKILAGPAALPEGAEDPLAQAGFVRASAAAGMVAVRSGFRPRALPPGFSIAEVSSAPDWLAWSGIVCRNLFDSEGAGSAEAFARSGSALASGPGFRAFLGRDQGGRPIATSAALECGETGGVFFVAVESEARGRGYGAAVTSRATAACFDAGFGYASLSASDLGRPVYEGLGYRRVSTLVKFLPPLA